jgi:RNA polymerase primary sigma factor
MSCAISRYVTAPAFPALAPTPRTPRLSAGQEHELAQGVARGDADARDRLVRSNLRLVVTIARRYLGHGLDLDDLAAEGNLGLIRAARDFKPEFGTRFSTYAAHWIKQAIRDALTNTAATIRLPSHMVNLLRKWRRGERLLSRELGQTPTEEQVAIQLGLTDAQLELVRRAKRAGKLRLESGIGGDGTAWSPEEAPDEREAPEAALEAVDERHHLLRRLDRLDAREREIITLRFGLGDGEPRTLKEVGRRLGVTREWVRKLEIRAIAKLRVADRLGQLDQAEVREPGIGTVDPLDRSNRLNVGHLGQPFARGRPGVQGDMCSPRILLTLPMTSG